MEPLEPTAHPAIFSDSIIHALKQYLPDFIPDGATVLDPFAGSGKIHFLRPPYQTFGIEIEPEWAVHSKYTKVGDASDPTATYPAKSFNAVVTSPCYGNRLADHYDAKDASKRFTYRGYLGRPVTENSAAKMQWGNKYREFHRDVFIKMRDMLIEGGYCIINISNHVRKHEIMPVVDWYREMMQGNGFILKEELPIKTPRLGFGENHALRVEEEWILFYEMVEI